MELNKSNITIQEFKEYLRETPANVTILKLGAKWCGPCKHASKYMATILPQYKDKSYNYIEIDIDENQDMYKFFKRSLGVNGIPTIMVYRKNDYDDGTFYAPFRVVSGFNNTIINDILKETFI
tara:strand:+ start:349 stop:717 length:369 start_codon:yes stop_codon:yes gene_type:complete